MLDAIVVAGEWRGRGIGRSLTSAFLGAVTVAGVDRVEVVTKDGPQGAGGFYERGGWSRTLSHLDGDGDVVHTYAIRPARRAALVTTLSRRALMLGGLTAMAGCSVREDVPVPVATTRGPFRRSSPTSAPDPALTFTPYVPWQSGTGEVHPQAKVAADRAVEALGSGSGRLTRVVYPQYGGLLPDMACVMVVAYHRVDADSISACSGGR